MNTYYGPGNVIRIGQQHTVQNIVPAPLQGQCDERLTFNAEGISILDLGYPHPIVSSPLEDIRRERGNTPLFLPSVNSKPPGIELLGKQNGERKTV